VGLRWHSSSAACACKTSDVTSTGSSLTSSGSVTGSGLERCSVRFSAGGAVCDDLVGISPGTVTALRIPVDVPAFSDAVCDDLVGISPGTVTALRIPVDVPAFSDAVCDDLVGISPGTVTALRIPVDVPAFSDAVCDDPIVGIVTWCPVSSFPVGSVQ